MQAEMGMALLQSSVPPSLVYAQSEAKEEAGSAVVILFSLIGVFIRGI